MKELNPIPFDELRDPELLVERRFWRYYKGNPNQTRQRGLQKVNQYKIQHIKGRMLDAFIHELQINLHID